MKKVIILITVLLIGVTAYAVLNARNDDNPAKSAAREARVAKRAARQEAYEKLIDSIVVAQSFQFNPQTMQQQPAGRSQMLANPNFTFTVWNGTADIFLPYIKGYTPPYHTVLFNYTVSTGRNLYIEPTDNGWIVKFDNSLFSATTYTFTLEIAKKYGTATLIISNPWYNDVQYYGSISQVY